MLQRRKPPKERISPQSPVSLVEEPDVESKEVEIQTEVSGVECGCDSKIEMLMKEVSVLKCKYQERKFRLANIKNDDSKISFYTSFPNYDTLKACYEFLGTTVDFLVYDSNKQLLDGESSKCCRPRALLPEDEFFSFSSVTSRSDGSC